MMPSTMELTTKAVSYKLSFTPSWISDGDKNIACPPKAAILDSLATRVRVLRLLKIKAIVFLSRDDSMSDKPKAVNLALCFKVAECCRMASNCSGRTVARVNRLGTLCWFVEMNALLMGQGLALAACRRANRADDEKIVLTPIVALIT